MILWRLLEIGHMHHENRTTTRKSYHAEQCALWSEWAAPYEVNARCRLENQFPLSSFKWSIFFVSCCQLHLGPFNSMGQLEIPSCLILTAGMLVCAVTSSPLREAGEEGSGNECNTLSSSTLAPTCPHRPTPLFISFSPLLLFPFSLESRTKAIDVKLSKMNLATCVTYRAGRRGGWGQATTAALGSFVTQPWLALTKQYPKNSPK